MNFVYVNEAEEKELEALYPIQDSLNNGELSRDEYEEKFASKLEAIAKKYNIVTDACSVWIECKNGQYYLGFEQS
jgi:hypothetical protein